MKISIEGNIGSGKSSVITRICQTLRLPVFLEPIDEWHEWLSQFYKDPERWGMSFNLKVLMSYHKWRNNTFPAIYERSPLSNRYIFSQLQYDQGKMSKLELDLFDQVYRQLAWFPDYVIYIQTDPKTSMERMVRRARGCESTVPLTYLEAVHNKYEDLLVKNTVIQSVPKVFVVDGNNTAEEVYEKVVTIINDILNKDA